MKLRLHKSGTMQGGEIHYHWVDHERIGWRIKCKVGPNRWLSKRFEKAGVAFIGEARNASFHTYEFQSMGDVAFKLVNRALANLTIEVKFAYGSATVNCHVNDKEMIDQIDSAVVNVNYGPLRANFKITQ